MIGSFILFVLWIVVYGISSPLRLFPDVSLPSELTASISTASGSLTAMSAFIPISTILAIFAIVVAIEASIFLYKGVMWIIKRLPTQS